MSALSRRAFLLAAATLLAAQAPPPRTTQPASAPTLSGNTLSHRGFTVDISLTATMPHRDAVIASLQRQIEITADCGAKPEIMAFFRAQKISLKTDKAGGPGRFRAGTGVEIQAAAQPVDNPILLHELIHALHYLYLPDRGRNPDVLQFYQNAQAGQLYPANEYVMSNVGEFFAVTASLYLWGKVARPPHDRETLRAKQPYYYAWLGELFGVKK
jgi:hypothetical protein